MNYSYSFRKVGFFPNTVIIVVKMCQMLFTANLHVSPDCWHIYADDDALSSHAGDII